MRIDRLNWNDHHMLLALTTAQRSPDPNTQVGCSIVDQDSKIVSLGYNGTPRGIDPKDIPWERTGNPENTKYPFIVHAERNAILNANRSVKNCCLVVTMFPCEECTKEIIQAGIKEVIYLKNPYKDTWQVKTSEWMLQKASIDIIQHQWQSNINQFLIKDLL